jgi:hypothetical protein
MQFKKTIVLDLEEAKKALATWYADYLSGDHENLLQLIQEGKLHGQIPDLTTMEPMKVAETYQGWDFLADQWMDENPDVDLFLIDLGEGNFFRVCGREDYPPKPVPMKTAEQDRENLSLASQLSEAVPGLFSDAKRLSEIGNDSPMTDEERKILGVGP